MKIKEITITGMHKVVNKTYQLNDSVTYFVGENGAGKSTILEAIQLALLGYIPGYAKTNESIMKHASGPMMSVELKLDNDISINRMWMRSGATVKSTLNVEGYDKETLPDLIGNIELPVFNFNEFKSLTANKLKDWFITFLPPSDDNLDIVDRLRQSVTDRNIDVTHMLDEVDSWIKTSENTGLELVRALNTKFKDDQTYVKGKVTQLESTIQSLVKYDDIDEVDEDAARAEIKLLTNLKNSVTSYNTALQIHNNNVASLEKLKANLPADKIENDSRVKQILDKINLLEHENETIKSERTKIESGMQALTREKMLIPKSSSTC